MWAPPDEVLHNHSHSTPASRRPFTRPSLRTKGELAKTLLFPLKYAFSLLM